MAALDEYFSILALFILFRETIEASIICGVLLQFLNRAKPALKKTVWWGVAGGVIVSIIFGVIFIAIYYTAQNNLFKGTNRDWFKGIISWVAALLITILGFAMLRFVGWEAKWKRRLEAAVAKEVPVAAVVGGDVSSAPLPPATGFDSDANASSSDGAAAGSGSPLEDGAAKPNGAATAKAATAQTLTTTSDSSGAASTGAAGKALPSDGAAKAALPPLDKTSGAMILPAATSDDLELGAVPGAIGDDADATTAVIVDGKDMSPATRKEAWKIFLLVFTTVVREGIESVVFLGGLGNVKLTAIPLAAFVGITAGCLVGIFLFYSGKTVKHIKWLVISMAVIIFFIAAGQVNLGTDALMRAGLFGYCSPWLDERPWFMIPMYDWSVCCGDMDPKGDEPTDVQNRKRFFALARAIFGYQDKATPLEVIIYCCYWGLMLILMAFKAWRGTLFDADFKHTREMKKLKKEAARKEAEEAALAALEAAKVGALEGGHEVGKEAEVHPALLGLGAPDVKLLQGAASEDSYEAPDGKPVGASS